MTLLEVVLSMTIFLGALAALGQLMSTGMQAAVQSRLQTQAILRCESKLAEILGGIEPMQSVDGVSFDDDPSWTWSLEVIEGPRPDLLELNVGVARTGQNELGTMSYSIRRFVRDPQLFLDAAEEEAAIAMEDE